MQPAMAHAPPLATAELPAGVEPPEAPQRPQLQVEGGLTRLRIPFDGTLDNVRARIWAQPRALAIDLPRGHTPLPPGSYAIAQGSVSELRLNARGAETLVRIKLAAPIERYSLAAQDGVLEVRLVQQGVAVAAGN